MTQPPLFPELAIQVRTRRQDATGLWFGEVWQGSTNLAWHFPFNTEADARAWAETQARSMA